MKFAIFTKMTVIFNTVLCALRDCHAALRFE